jgi:hypothetical protein
MLSVEPVQVRFTELELGAAAVRFVGVLGATVSDVLAVATLE